MPKRKPITRDFLISILHYDPTTGHFTWKARQADPAWTGKLAGKRAGYVMPIGYRSIAINNAREYEHRLAFLWMTGSIPTFVDHANCDRSDNRWSNLRAATKTLNQANMPPRRDNTSGHKGVSLHRMTGKWTAEIRANGVKRYLGLFDSKAEAAKAYATAAAELFGEFARP